jgi:membrane fusion protein (multidrug efflux system)
MTNTVDRSADAQVGAPSRKARRSFFKSRKFFIIAGLGLLILLILGIRYYLYAMTHQSTDDAYIDGNVIQVSPKVAGYIAKMYVKDNQEVKAGDLLAEIDPRDFQNRLDQARALLDASRARHQSAESSIALIKKTSTATVEEASAAAQSAASGVQAARAQVVAAEGRLGQARAAVITALANAEQARSEVTAAEAERNWAQAEAQRYQLLLERDEISRQRVDQAQTQLQTAQARLQAAQQKLSATVAQVSEARATEKAVGGGLEQAQSGVAVAKANVAEAHGKLTAAGAAPQQIAVSQAEARNAGASIEQTQAAVEQAELELSYTKILAPETGRVTRKAVEAGSYAEVGQALMAIVPGDVWVTANFKETQLEDIKVGQSVEVSVDSYPRTIFKAHVDSIQAGTGARFSLLPPENATGNFVKVVQRIPVKIVFDQPYQDLVLAVGMSAVPQVKIK